jgi:hypothetical protein
MEKSKNEILYDENSKKFLSQKIILAHILVGSVREFGDMAPKDVVPLIEGTPEVSKVRVHTDGSTIDEFMSKRITGMNTEESSREEGTVYYDIKFYVYTRSKKELIKLIIDVEAQNKFNPGYDMVTRGIYYCARQLSSQKETEFEGSDYDNIKKVYSIWICTQCPKELENTITEFSMTQKNIVGGYPDRSRYDLLSVILIGLSQDIAESSDEHKLHRLLETFFSSKLSENDKRKIIEEEYDITYSTDIERSVRGMCNVSQGLIEIGKAEALTNLQNAILDKRKYGYTAPEDLIKLGYDAETSEIAINIG